MKERKKKIVKKIIILIVMILFLAGCSSAETASYNISKNADEFKVKRRITFVNLRSDTFLFQITGNCSIQGPNSSDELEVICKIGKNKYQKHFLKNSVETTYIIEQLEYINVSRYDYEIIFRPEAIIPIKIKTQIGE